MKKIIGLLVIALLLCCGWVCAEEAPQWQIPYPSNIENPSFSISEEGELVAFSNEHVNVWNGEAWVSIDSVMPSNHFTVKRSEISGALQIMKGTQMIYATFAFDALYPINEEESYGTIWQKLYHVNLKTNARTLLCYVDGLWNEKAEQRDKADMVVASADTIYVIQSGRKWIFAINRSWALEQSGHVLSIAVTSNVDIANDVLSTAERLFFEQHSDLLVDIQRIPFEEVQNTLCLVPDTYDLIVADTSSWQDFTEIWLDLNQDIELKSIWEETWHDMELLCAEGEKWLGVPLWDETVLWHADVPLAQKLGVSLPDANWTWEDFFILAQQCRQSGTKAGEGDLYITYRQMQFLDNHSDTLYYASPLVRQVVALCSEENISCDDPRILRALEIWKNCVEQGLLCETPVSIDDVSSGQVLFSGTLPNEWFSFYPESERTIVFPGFGRDLPCTPAQSIFLGINQNSAKLDAAKDFFRYYLQFGADERGYLTEHQFHQKMMKQQEWNWPPQEHISHFETAFLGARRDMGNILLYEAMENALSQYLEGTITIDECIEEWTVELSKI